MKRANRLTFDLYKNNRIIVIIKVRRQQSNSFLGSCFGYILDSITAKFGSVYYVAQGKYAHSYALYQEKPNLISSIENRVYAITYRHIVNYITYHHVTINTQ